MWEKHPTLPIEAHPDGRVRYTKTMYETFGRDNSSGYKRFSLNNGKNKVRDYMVHRLVAETFIENTQNKPYINHKNGARHDNRIENLEWCTVQENSRHSVDVLKSNYNPMIGKFGAEHNRSKSVKVLKDNIVIGIYGSIRESARKLNIGCSNISSVLAGNRTMAHGYKFEWA